MLLGGPLERLGGSFSRLDGVILQHNDCIHNMCVLLDLVLSMEHQIPAVSRSTFHQLSLIAQLYSYLDWGVGGSVLHKIGTCAGDLQE